LKERQFVAKSGSRKSSKTETPKTPRWTPARRAKSKLEGATAVAEPPDQNADSADRDFEPSDEEVRVRAYFRYLERGGSHGESMDDWAEAKKELLSARRKPDA
jgi:hypothetical protein